MLLKGYEVFRFVWNYALPIVVFAFCYYRILMVLRRQNKVVGTHAAPPRRVQVVEMVPVSPNDGNATPKAGTSNNGTRYSCLKVSKFLYSLKL